MLKLVQHDEHTIMTTVDITKLKQLREETGISYALCKKSLEDSGNDIEKAKKLLEGWGIEKAKSKANRETKQGSLFSYIHHNKKLGAFVEVLCETDFVATNEDFQTLGNDIAMHIASVHPESEAELLASLFIKDQSKTIDNLIKEYILKIGENIKIGKFVRFEI